MYSELWEILTTFLSFDYPLEILLNLIDRVPSPRAGTNSWLRLIDWDFLINLKKTSETSEKCPRGHLQMFCFVQSKVLDSKCIHFTFRKQERIYVWDLSRSCDQWFLFFDLSIRNTGHGALLPVSTGEDQTADLTNWLQIQRDGFFSLCHSASPDKISWTFASGAGR